MTLANIVEWLRPRLFLNGQRAAYVLLPREWEDAFPEPDLLPVTPATGEMLRYLRGVRVVFHDGPPAVHYRVEA